MGSQTHTGAIPVAATPNKLLVHTTAVGGCGNKTRLEAKKNIETPLNARRPKGSKRRGTRKKTPLPLPTACQKNICATRTPYPVPMPARSPGTPDHATRDKMRSHRHPLIPFKPCSKGDLRWSQAGDTRTREGPMIPGPFILASARVPMDSVRSHQTPGRLQWR